MGPSVEREPVLIGRADPVQAVSFRRILPVFISKTVSFSFLSLRVSFWFSSFSCFPCLSRSRF